MCITLISTSHPLYSLILLSNRDEYLSRPTAPLSHWPSPHEHVLSGRDLERPVHGTWLGLTTHGRLAVLTNFREENSSNEAASSAVGSRGEIAKKILTSDPNRDVGGVVMEMVEQGMQGVGGFSVIFGDVAPTGEEVKMGIISNRTTIDDGKGIHWLGRNGEKKDVIALSNSHYGDRAWPKVVEGERLLGELVATSAVKATPEDKEDFIAKALELLSTDTLPRREPGQEWEVYLRHLRNSIFIPAIGGEEKPAEDIATAKGTEAAKVPEYGGGGGLYGTQKQSVILVSKTGEVTFVERTLFDADSRPTREDRQFDFMIKPPK